MPTLHLVGIHCHLGSTINNLDAFKQAVIIMAKKISYLKENGFPVRYLNLGGGLGIDYFRVVESGPSPSEFVESITEFLPPGCCLDSGTRPQYRGVSRNYHL
jgi:diaminopimelate decarboxylase